VTFGTGQRIRPKRKYFKLHPPSVPVRPWDEAPQWRRQGAALGDRFGRRRLFAAGIALFTLASVACALSGPIGGGFQHKLRPGDDGCGSTFAIGRGRRPRASGPSSRGLGADGTKCLRSIAIRYRPIGKPPLVRTHQWIHNRADGDT
jgi:hypothetical protein